MSSLSCDSCGCDFRPQSRDWGETCGVCIAARIELALVRATLGTNAGRRPMRRAPDEATAPTAYEPLEHRA